MDFYVIPVSGEESEDVFIIYKPLSGLAFIGNKTMVELATALSKDPSQAVGDDIRNFLDSVGFFAPTPPAPPRVETGPFNPTNVALLMTNQCQLRCTYCYAGAGDFPRQQLSLDIGRAAIDYVYENLKRLQYPKYLISLHGGGEPTFPWKTLKKLVEYAKEKPITTEFSLTSNGVWSEEQTQWIMANIGSVGISMDGSPQTQDLQRPMASGKGSSPVVMRSIRTMDEHKFFYGIRLTAVPPFDRLIDDIRFLCENTACAQMQVEAAFNTRRGEEALPSISEGLHFLEVFFEAQRVAESYNRNLRSAGSDFDKITATACGSPFNTMVVNPQHNLVACFEIVNDSHPLTALGTLGKISANGVEVDEEKRAVLHKKIEERRASCQDCFCYWSCAGDCLIRSFSPDAASHLEHGVRCEMVRTMQREMLLKQISAGNGVWRRNNQAMC